jgi:penicillin amidase
MAKGKAGKVVKVTLIVLIALIVLVCGGGYAYYFFITHSPLQQVDGELKVQGLKERVEVIRDSYGTPHIYARNLIDLFFAQGYVQAQDRWWQMEFFRKTCGGRIGELTGKKAALVKADIYLRSLGLYRVAQQEYKNYPPEQRAILEAFAGGVNAYISGRSPRQLSVNYSILGLTGVKFQMDPWTPLDSLVFSKLMAWDLGLSRDLEIIRSKLHDRLGAEMAEQWLVPAWPLGRKPTILSDEDIKSTFTTSLNIDKYRLNRPVSAGNRVNNAPSTDRSLLQRELLAMTAGIDDSATDLSLIMGQTEGTGSNSWVAVGNLTQGGKPLLANDPHLGIQQPSIWYQVALHCPDDGSGRPFDVTGFSFALIPGVIIGHNNDIAWGITNVYPDLNDQYLIKINPANPLQYEWNGKWRNMAVRDEIISFGNGKPSLSIKVRQTHLGPIINDHQYNQKSGEMAGHNNKDPLALHWTGLTPSSIALAISGLNKAKNWNDFRAALQYWDTPPQSFIYADREGNIGYEMPGRIPVRVKNHTGQVPAPGWIDEYEWKGYVPYDLLPRLYNPARNYIVASNQEVAPPDYFAMLNIKLGPNVNAHFGSKFNKWVYGYRSQRTNELVKQFAPHTMATYQKMQGDSKSIPAAEILPALAGLRFSDPTLADARNWLLQWDCMSGEDSPQAALFNWFIMRLMKNIFQPKLEGIAKSDGVDKELWAVTLLLQKPDDPWWDDPATKDKRETRDEILVRSFQEAHAATMAALGKDRSRWKWGMLHKATFVSNPLGASGIKPIESLVNRGPVPVGGSTECVNNNMWYAGNGNFSVRLIPSMRMIVDLADFDKSVAVNSTGNSGHPGSPGYDSQILPWARVQYRPMLWSKKQVEADAKHRLFLNP